MHKGLTPISPTNPFKGGSFNQGSIASETFGINCPLPLHTVRTSNSSPPEYPRTRFILVARKSVEGITGSKSMKRRSPGHPDRNLERHWRNNPRNLPLRTNFGHYRIERHGQEKPLQWFMILVVFRGIIVKNQFFIAPKNHAGRRLSIGQHHITKSIQIRVPKWMSTAINR